MNFIYFELCETPKFGINQLVYNEYYMAADYWIEQNSNSIII